MTARQGTHLDVVRRPRYQWLVQPKRDWLAGGTICLLAFVILFGYAIARPATESLFLAGSGSGALPGAWLAVAVGVTVTVLIMNAAAARVRLSRLLLGAVAVTAVSLALLLVARRQGYVVDLWLYVWKDIHVVVLLEILWSFASVVFKTKTAKWAYGIFCAAGSIGGFAGNITVGKLATLWGTSATLTILFGVFFLVGVIGLVLGRITGDPAPSESDKPKNSFWGGAQIVKRSHILPWMLGLIAVVQLVVTLIDYQYSVMIEATYPNLDERTAVIGKVYAAIDVASLCLQLATGFVLKFAGVRGALVGVPIVMSAAVATIIAAPSVATVVLAKITNKALDYSIFRSAKELLYIPLSYSEKTQGKSVVDILTYRVAKGVASFLVIALLLVSPAAIPIAIAVLTGTWIALAWVVARKHAEGGAEAER